MPSKFPCKGCGWRHRQFRDYCRTCARERNLLPVSGEIPPADGRTAQPVPRAGKLIPASQRAIDPSQPVLTRIIEGVEYDIVFDGTRPSVANPCAPAALPEYNPDTDTDPEPLDPVKRATPSYDVANDVASEGDVSV